MGERCLEKFHRSAPGAELESDNKEERKLEEEDRGDHGLKTGRSTTEEEEEEEEEEGGGEEEEYTCN
jgi:hypothetical protein